MREQTTVRVSYEWTTIFVFIFPAFDRTLASRAGEVVRRQRRKSFRLQADASDSSYSVAIRSHQISCDVRCVAATVFSIRHHKFVSAQLHTTIVPPPSRGAVFETVSAAPDDSG